MTTTTVPTRSAPSKDQPDHVSQEKPTAGMLVRALAVVGAGPLLLDALEVLGPLSALGRWPSHVPAGPVRRLGWRLTAAGVAALAIDHGAVRPWLRRKGSTCEERRRRMPGDAAGPVLFTNTRAVTVQAPARDVWRWLVQIGQDRGGFYSYDWLENLAGCRLRSAEEIHEEWQHRSPGDELSIFPGYATTLADVDPPHALVIDNWGSYVVEPIDDSTCRLLARSHADRGAGGAAYMAFIELPHAIMELRMLEGIKERAER